MTTTSNFGWALTMGTAHNQYYFQLLILLNYTQHRPGMVSKGLCHIEASSTWSITVAAEAED